MEKVQKREGGVSTKNQKVQNSKFGLFDMRGGGYIFFPNENVDFKCFSWKENKLVLNWFLGNHKCFKLMFLFAKQINTHICVCVCLCVLSFANFCMTLYDCVWLCMTMYGYFWFCFDMYDYVLLCMTKYDYVLLCTTMYDNVYQCMTMNDKVWLCMTMYD